MAGCEWLLRTREVIVRGPMCCVAAPGVEVRGGGSAALGSGSAGCGWILVDMAEACRAQGSGEALTGRHASRVRIRRETMVAWQASRRQGWRRQAWRRQARRGPGAFTSDQSIFSAETGSAPFD